MPIDSVTTEWLIGILGWVSFVILGFAVVYLWRAITFGTIGKAKAAGKGLKELKKKAKKVPRKVRRALRREYKIVDRLERALKRFEIAFNIGNVSKQSSEYKEINKELTNAVDMYAVIADLVDKSEDIADKTSKKDIKKDLKIFDGEIRKRLAKSGNESIIEYINSAVHHMKSNPTQAKANLQQAIKLTDELKDYILDIEATEKKIKKLS